MSRPKRLWPKCPWPKCLSTAYLDVSLVYEIISFLANNLGPDLDWQNVSPDLDPKPLTLIVLLKEFLKSQHSQQHKSMMNYPACIELKP